jgi:hypothetical protein
VRGKALNPAQVSIETPGWYSLNRVEVFDLPHGGIIGAGAKVSAAWD